LQLSQRLFRDDLKEEAECYELQRAGELKPYLQKADFVLDLHSVTEPSEPFLMSESDGLSVALQLGVQSIVIGWEELGEQNILGDTETYASAYGAKAFTVENGPHQDPRSAEHAYSISLRFLTFTGLIDGTLPTACNSQVFELFQVVTKRCHSFSFTRRFYNLEILKSGELIAQDRDTQYYAPEDCIIVMPHFGELELGKELFFLARQVKEVPSQEGDIS